MINDSPPDEHWPVVIVGAGPAGLTAAITLASSGIGVLVVDGRFERSRQPRATVVSLRTMELFRSWKIDEQIRAGGNQVQWKMLVTSTLADSSSGQTIDVGYPTDEQSALVSPTSVACVPQDHLENVLLDHLRTLPAARVLVGSMVEEVSQQPDHGIVRLRDRASGVEQSVTADYVVGADGAHSRTRRDVGIDRWSSGRLLEAVSVVFRAPIWELVGPQRFGLYHVEHPGATGSFLPAGGHDRWLYSFLWDPEQEELTDYSEARLVELIRVGAGNHGLPVHIDSLGAFSFVASLATRFRLGRVFLIGDAAHQVTPRGGTGMNTAIADGFDLGWKLAWVLNGWHDDTLLDTYEIERRPVAEHNVTRSIDPEGSRREVSYELSVDLGGRLRHLWLPHTRTSTLDLLGPGLTLLTTDESASAAGSSGIPIRRQQIDSVTARALGIRSSTGLLLRPDGLLWSEQ
ncbi:MAG: FAD-dependent monooxygenase, partial [Nakamurella sp.]